jgi:hypothetical protein
MTKLLHTTENSYVIDDDMDHWIPLNKIDPLILKLINKKNARIMRLEKITKWLVFALIAAFFGFAKIFQIYEHCDYCL